MNHSHLSFVLEKAKGLANLKQIHAKALTLGLLHNHQSLASKILNTYAKLNYPQEAQKVFDRIIHPDIVSYTNLLHLYLHYQLPGYAFSTFSRLIHTRLTPDSYSVVAALSACGRKKDVLSGRTVHGIIFRFQLGLDPFVGNALIDMYSRNGEISMACLVFKKMQIKDVASWNSLLNGFILCNDLERALNVFNQMPERNSVSWTAMINGCFRGEKPIRALELFRLLKAEGKNHPTAATIVVVLSGCADVGALHLGQSIHGYINKYRLSSNVTVNNALMDMYSKNGSFDLAISLFNEIANKDVFSWTTVISGYAFFGKGNHALAIYFDMLESGVVPNEVTFLSLLSACSHSGLLVEGQRIFHRMIHCCGIKPKIDHYGCVVDLLCRAGLIKEAKEFIETMPINPDAVIWRSLLNACWVHGDLNSVEMIKKKINELEPDDDGTFVILSNIYFPADRQDYASNTRKLMRNRKIKKRPGCSWLEVNGLVHEFLAGAAMHYGLAEVDLVLKSITEQLRLDMDSSSLGLD